MNKNLSEQLWLWSHPAGSHNTGCKLPGASSITPVDAARFMGIPNVIMVRYGGHPQPEDFVSHLEPLKNVPKVIWSVIGDSSTKQTKADDTELLRLTPKYPNLKGAMMDDFFPTPSTPCRLLPEEVKNIKENLEKTGLELWVVLYDHQLDQDISAYLPYCDVINFWTWKAENLRCLEDNLSRVKKTCANKKIALGCYMWDYGSGGAPIPLDTMEFQGETALKYLKNGDIQSIVFLGSCICDLNIEAVSWTKNWIRQNRSLKI